MSTPNDDINESTHSTASSKRSRSSFFARARMSFARAGGTRGASVETLRGTRGADFEGKGFIRRGAPEGLCFGCCGGWCGDRDSNKEHFFLIKGPFCFVFSNEKSSSPKYAIGLQFMKANAKKDSSVRGGHVTVFLENNLGDLEYEFVFNDETVAGKFCRTVERQAASAQAEVVRKRLGHENLVVKRTSMRYAEDIAKQKENDQPDVPVTTEEIMANMPQVPM